MTDLEPGYLQRERERLERLQDRQLGRDLPETPEPRPSDPPVTPKKFVPKEEDKTPKDPYFDPNL